MMDGKSSNGVAAEVGDAVAAVEVISNEAAIAGHIEGREKNSGLISRRTDEANTILSSGTAVTAVPPTFLFHAATGCASVGPGGFVVARPMAAEGDRSLAAVAARLGDYPVAALGERLLECSDISNCCRFLNKETSNEGLSLYPTARRVNQEELSNSSDYERHLANICYSYQGQELLTRSVGACCCSGKSLHVCFECGHVCTEPSLSDGRSAGAVRAWGEAAAVRLSSVEQKEPVVVHDASEETGVTVVALLRLPFCSEDGFVASATAIPVVTAGASLILLAAASVAPSLQESLKEKRRDQIHQENLEGFFQEHSTAAAHSPKTMAAELRFSSSSVGYIGRTCDVPDATRLHTPLHTLHQAKLTAATAATGGAAFRNLIEDSGGATEIFGATPAAREVNSTAYDVVPATLAQERGTPFFTTSNPYTAATAASSVKKKNIHEDLITGGGSPLDCISVGGGGCQKNTASKDTSQLASWFVHSDRKKRRCHTVYSSDIAIAACLCAAYLLRPSSLYLAPLSLSSLFFFSLLSFTYWAIDSDHYLSQSPFIKTLPTAHFSDVFGISSFLTALASVSMAFNPFIFFPTRFFCSMNFLIFLAAAATFFYDTPIYETGRTFPVSWFSLVFKSTRVNSTAATVLLLLLLLPVSVTATSTAAITPVTKEEASKAVVVWTSRTYAADGGYGRWEQLQDLLLWEQQHHESTRPIQRKLTAVQRKEWKSQATKYEFTDFEPEDMEEVRQLLLHQPEYPVEYDPSSMRYFYSMPLFSQISVIARIRNSSSSPPLSEDATTHERPSPIRRRGEIVGVVGASADHQSAHVVMVAVATAHRRQGLEALLRRREEKIRKLGGDPTASRASVVHPFIMTNLAEATPRMREQLKFFLNRRVASSLVAAALAAVADKRLHPYFLFLFPGGEHNSDDEGGGEKQKIVLGGARDSAFQVDSAILIPRLPSQQTVNEVVIAWTPRADHRAPLYLLSALLSRLTRAAADKNSVFSGVHKVNIKLSVSEVYLLAWCWEAGFRPIAFEVAQEQQQILSISLPWQRPQELTLQLQTESIKPYLVALRYQLRDLRKEKRMRLKRSPGAAEKRLPVTRKETQKLSTVPVEGFLPGNSTGMSGALLQQQHVVTQRDGAADSLSNISTADEQSDTEDKVRVSAEHETGWIEDSLHDDFDVLDECLEGEAMGGRWEHVQHGYEERRAANIKKLHQQWTRQFMEVTNAGVSERYGRFFKDALGLLRRWQLSDKEEKRESEDQKVPHVLPAREDKRKKADGGTTVMVKESRPQEEKPTEKDKEIESVGKAKGEQQPGKDFYRSRAVVGIALTAAFIFLMVLLLALVRKTGWRCTNMCCCCRWKVFTNGSSRGGLDAASAHRRNSTLDIERNEIEETDTGLPRVLPFKRTTPPGPRNSSKSSSSNASTPVCIVVPRSANTPTSTVETHNKPNIKNCAQQDDSNKRPHVRREGYAKVGTGVHTEYLERDD